MRAAELFGQQGRDVRVGRQMVGGPPDGYYIQRLFTFVLVDARTESPG